MATLKHSRFWKPLPSWLRKDPRQPENIPRYSTRKPSVAFISSNGLVRDYLSRKPLSNEYVVRMFTTVHGHFLTDHDIILLDHSLEPFTLESYITRDSMKSSLPADLELMQHPPYPPEPAAAPERRKIPSATSYFSAVRFEGPSSATRPPPPLSRTHSFPDFATLYHEYDFPGYAEATSSLLKLANRQLATWKGYMVNEGGFSLIRVRDPINGKLAARRCVLLPKHAIKHWGSEINSITKQWLDFSRRHFNLRTLRRVEKNLEEMEKLFYVKRIGLDAPQRRNFGNVPVWKMEVMLKKWRTDKALEEWSASYRR